MRFYSTHAAIKVIQHEHDLLDAVIHGMAHLARSIEKGKNAPDLKVFRVMLYYIRNYPEKVHHPKEDLLLFAKLRERTNELDKVIEELETQHALGERLVAQLERALARYEIEGKAAFEPFYLLVEQYAGFYWSHMRLEEEKILPTAAKVLTEQDWVELDAAFSENDDPLNGGQAAEEMKKLFTQIVNIAPPPIGLGPEV